MGVPELIERGIRAYLAGRERDALSVFEQVLALDPENKKARWYIDKLRAAGVTTPEPARIGTPLQPAAAPAAPAPAAAAPAAPAPFAAAAATSRAPAPAPAVAPAADAPAFAPDIDIALTPVPMAGMALEVQASRLPPPPVPMAHPGAPGALAPPPAPFAGAVPWPAPPAGVPPLVAPPAPPDPFAGAVPLQAAPVAPAPPAPPPAPAAPARSAQRDAARAAAHAVIAAALDLGADGPAATPPPVAPEPPRPAAAPAPAPAVEPADLHAPEEDYVPSPWDDGPAAAATIVLEAAGGLDLGAVEDKSDLRPLVPEGARPTPGPRNDVEVWLAAAKELFALGDFSGSLELIEKILQVDPDHGEARDYLRQNEATLISMYESKLGPLTRVPRLAIKPEEILWLNLDHRAGFLLAQIDGTVDYDSLFALSGLPRLDTARILANLIADGVIRS